jgi:hypothetical protein
MEKRVLNVPVMAKDNMGHTYRVTVFTGGTKPGESYNSVTKKLEQRPEDLWMLCINETPGHWYMVTLLDPVLGASHGHWDGPNPSKVISIDFGQDWTCVNFDEVMLAAIRTICCAKTA